MLCATLAAAATGSALAPRAVDAAQPPSAGPSCSVSAGSVAFGAYDPLSPTHLDSTGTIGLTCAVRQVATISLGTGQSGTFAARELRGPGGAALRYHLYTDATRTQVWGDGTAGTATSPFETERGRHVPVYARVLAGQDVPAGAYSDTVVVTIQF